MHQLILLTAMTATSGLFGGGKHCGKPHHGKKAVASSCYSASPCGATHAAPHAAMSMPAPSMQSYPAAPMAPAMTVPPAPAVPPAPPLPTPSSANNVPTGRPAGDPSSLAPVVSTGDLR